MYLFIPLFDASNLDPSILTWSYQMKPCVPLNAQTVKPPN